MAALVGCDVHPLNNLRVLKAGRKLADGEPAPVDDWVKGWITQGFAALEELISTHGDGFCFGDAPTLADCYLIPQVYSARRFKVPLDAFPRIVAVDERAARLDAFDRAHPDRQPDAPAA
jgi:maleylpyruvate isomerase